jgi:hypothetical protein
MSNRTSTRLRYLAIDIADLNWIADHLPKAIERSRRDTHPGIASNGLTADDGSHPGPIPQLATTGAVTADPVRRARDELLQAIDTIHQATHIARHAIHRLLPLNPTDARALAEGETLEPISTPCTNPHCTNHAETNRTQCRACRAYRARTGHDRGPELTNTDTHNVSTTGHTQNPTNTAPTNA